MATVILDAGHGGADGGASYNGRLEKNDTLELALAIGELLQENGIDVLYTRTEDVYDSPVRKAQIANESGANYFVSIHRNSASYPGQYTGVQTLLYDETGIKKQMADNINQQLAEVGYRNIGTEVRKDLAVLRRTSMPALLVEVGFINSDTDNRLFDENFNETAQAIATGIINTINDADSLYQNTAPASRQMADGAVAVSAQVSQDDANPAPSAAGVQNNSAAQAGRRRHDHDDDYDDYDDFDDDDYDDDHDDHYDDGRPYRYSVQVGLYRQYQNAVNMAERLKAIRIPVKITQKNGLYAVLAGRLNTLEEAVRLERLLRLMCFDTLIVAV